MHIDPSEKRFSTAQVAKAADMTHANFRAHLSRGNWRMIGKPAEANGFGHLFSMHDALAIALARRLVSFGIEPKAAFESAVYDFAHGGDEERDPGGVFDPIKFGPTLFIYSAEAGKGRCVTGKHGTNPLAGLTPGGAEAGIIVDLNRLRDRVVQSLGLDARDYE